MVTKRKNSEAKDMEMYRMALVNMVNHPPIARLMAESGYDEEEMNKGRMLYDRAIKARSDCSIKRSRLSRISNQFSEAWKQMKALHSLHRRQAKAVFRRNTSTQIKLRLDKAMPQAYLPLKYMIFGFYSALSESAEYQEATARAGLTASEIRKGQELLSEVETLRSRYMRLKAESQNATDKKDAILRETDIWMQDFFAMAKIATLKHPKLLIALGKVLKN